MTLAYLKTLGANFHEEDHISITSKNMRHRQEVQGHSTYAGEYLQINKAKSPLGTFVGSHSSKKVLWWVKYSTLWMILSELALTEQLMVEMKQQLLSHW